MRLDTRYLPFKQELQKVKDGRITALLENAAQLILEHISLADMEDASLRDKAVAIGVFIDKLRLIRTRARRTSPWRRARKFWTWRP